MATRPFTLTSREFEILSLLGKGFLDREIAEQLDLTRVEVKQHFTAIYHKLELSNRLELLIYAYANGLIEPPH